MVISRNTSVSLDLLRASAALTVFLHHCNLLGLDNGLFRWFRRDVGHSAVVIFFVLSGYVISATLPRDGTAIDYGVKRASRIYSVALPAVLLTWMLDLASAHWRLPMVDSSYQLEKPWIYLPLALTFTGDFWGLAEPAFSNVPYWSLNYEVWYYVAFGLVLFVPGLLRWIGLLLVLVIMGPKLWLLFPIWLGGVAVCRLQQRKPLARPTARAMVVASLVLFLAVKILRLEDLINAEVLSVIGDRLSLALRFSKWFMGDYIVGILTMVLVYALGSAEFDVPPALRRPIVGIAAVSFSLYLVHYPLLNFIGQFFPGFGWITIVLSLAAACTFGAIFEPQKNSLRRLLTSMLTRHTS